MYASLYASIKTFIKQQIEECPRIAQTPLASWSHGKETQILVDTTRVVIDPDDHFPDDGLPGNLSPEAHNVRPIRIPHDHNTNPTHSDKTVSSFLPQWWTCIGTTGWNWKTQKSSWVGFDLDSNEGHVNGHDDATLQKAIEAALTLPFVQVRTSKSGRGFHLLRHFPEPLPIESAAEHQRLARHALEHMSESAEYDFSRVIDPQAVGLMLFHWASNLSPDGLQVLQPASI